jgi:hypothetical protein
MELEPSIAASGKADGEEEEREEEEMTTGMASVVILSAFLTYIIIGSVVMQYYEPDMTIFSGIYFNFVTLTTVGLGDMIPKR